MNLIIGVVAGVVSAIVIKIFWLVNRPSIKISPEIAKNSNNEYRIKFYNRSRISSISDIHIYLQLKQIVNSDGGQNVNTFDIPVGNPYIVSISRMKANDKQNEYAVRVAVSKDLESRWKDDTHMYLQLIISCSNGIKTSGRIFKMCYYKKSCIVRGSFECGRSMKIAPDD